MSKLARAQLTRPVASKQPGNLQTTAYSSFSFVQAVIKQAEAQLQRFCREEGYAIAVLTVRLGSRVDQLPL